MQLITKKNLKKIINKKKIINLDSFAIVFKTNNLLNLTRISRTQFLNLNEKTFSNKTLPSNIYFYNYNKLNELLGFSTDTIILIKHNSQYFYPNQLNSLLIDKNISKINNFLGLYKKFYIILKTISVKK